ncbi:MAG: hypothetical protein WCO78_05550 [Candidatus Roizmanbacteria bacterium]
MTTEHIHGIHDHWYEPPPAQHIDPLSNAMEAAESMMGEVYSSGADDSEGPTLSAIETRVAHGVTPEEMQKIMQKIFAVGADRQDYH